MGEKKPGTNPGFLRCKCSLPQDDARTFAIAFDINVLAGVQARIDRLSNRDQNAIRHAHNDLLPGYRLLMFFLDFVASQCATDRPCNHSDIASGACSDQTADAQSNCTASQCAQAGVVIVRDLRRSDLLDYPVADFHLAGLHAWHGARTQGEHEQIRKNTIHDNLPE